jgi:hypothetical protein
LLFGNARETDMEFDFRAGTVDDDLTQMAKMVVRKAQGDGTVPGPSAECRGCTALSRRAIDVAHAECFAVKEFRDASVEAVRLLLAAL